MALFYASDMDRAADAFPGSYTAASSSWDEFRGQYFCLPDWFEHGLDPLSGRFAQQQDKLWQLISGRSEVYEPELNEQAPEVRELDSLVRPGLYLQDTNTAGHHLIALGHLVKLSRVRAGDKVLEYGAGFGQIALAFARLGAIVDTVDINAEFCNAVIAQAKWFNVSLTAHKEAFGFNPRPDVKYDLIVFYECFHHARDFVDLIGRLHGMLADSGQVLLAGEPIAQPGSLAIPYPWGIRLDMETTAVVRIRGWYEIGFQEDFLLRCFVQNGFMVRKHPGFISEYATVYAFQKRPAIVRLDSWTLLPTDDVTWHGIEPNGRWTKGNSTFCLDRSADWNYLIVTATNFHPRRLVVQLSWGDAVEEIAFDPGERRTIVISLSKVAYVLKIISETIVPRSYGIADDRSLGLFVMQIEYRN